MNKKPKKPSPNFGVTSKNNMKMDKTQKIEKESIDFESTNNKFDLGRRLVREKYNINDVDIEAVEFIFWFVYFIERTTEDMIIRAECGVGARREAIQKMVDKLYFGDKISIVSDLYVKNRDKDGLIKLFRKVNDLRNDIAHGRFSDLIYGGRNLSDPKGQLKIVNDFINFANNMSPRTS